MDCFYRLLHSIKFPTFSEPNKTVISSELDAAVIVNNRKGAEVGCPRLVHQQSNESKEGINATFIIL